METYFNSLIADVAFHWERGHCLNKEAYIKANAISYAVLLRKNGIDVEAFKTAAASALREKVIVQQEAASNGKVNKKSKK